MYGGFVPDLAGVAEETVSPTVFGWGATEVFLANPALVLGRGRSTATKGREILQSSLQNLGPDCASQL